MSLAKILRPLALVAMASTPVLGEEIRDYYAEPGINPFKESISDSFHEQVDPFSGTLQLQYTDLHIPGNGGMDVTITRTYTSLQTNAYPTLNQNGLGWTMHFGRIVISRNHLPKLCNQGSFPLTTKENPSLELPDGGREILALSSTHSDGTMITRSNWIAKCTNGSSILVTAPNGTRYTMDRFDNFQEEPALLTTRIEDVRGNWIAIDYASNSLGINYITQIRRNEDGVVALFEYENQNSAGIAVSAITAGNQRVSYGYESIAGFLFDNYKQLVRATRPDGRSWLYTYNPKVPDPDPSDDSLEDGIASYSLTGVTYPYGAHIGYAYQYVQFDPGAPTQRTTAIQSKTVSGSDVTGGVWTYQFAPHSEPYDDNQSGQLRYDVTTVIAPEARYVYKHYGKDFRSGGAGTTVFVRPSFVGLLAIKETFSRSGSATLLERIANSWGQRKISEEDFWHGGGYREWWRDDGTYVAVLTGEYVSRDSAISGSAYAHARLFDDFDAYGNPGRVYSHSNVSSQPGHQALYTYHNDPSRWIIGVPDDETHQKVVGESTTTVGTIARVINQYGETDSIDEFGEETRYTYLTTGDLHTVRDARGNVTTYTNYKRGIAQSEQHPESVTILRVVNDNGTLRSKSDGRGNVTRYTYDDLHRLASIDYPIKADVSISYDPGTGSYRRILTRTNYQQTDTINDFGETRRVERHDTTTGQTVVHTSQFDASGREILTSYPNDTIGTSTTYDALGRTERIRHPDNSFVQYAHDDAQTIVTNERGNQTRYLYALLGTSYSLDDPAVIREPESVTTNIHRDVWGNVLELFQGEQVAAGTVRGYGKSYRYNTRRLLVESTEPEVGTTVYEHDAVGNVTSERINDLPITTFEFDDLNRRTRVNFSDATPDIVTEYDDSGNIERVTKGNTEWFYTIDENGNLRSERLTIGHPLLSSRVYLLSRDYSDLDVLSAITYPSGLVVDYAPDGFGRATRVGSFASNIAYHPSGSLASYQLANGVTTNIAINQRLMTRSIAAPGVVSLSYGYDASGNVMNITDAIDASKNIVMSASSYDGLDRLRYVRGKWGTANFTYDFHGNLKTKEIGARGLRFGLDASRRARHVDQFSAGNPSFSTGSIRLDYDKRGNTTARRKLTDVSTSSANLEEKLFIYDSASHLIRARVMRTTTSGTTAVAFKEYAYDGNGLRVLEQQHGSYDIRFSVHGSDGQLMFEDSLATCTRTDHIRLGSLGLAKSDDQFALPTLDSDGDQITDCYENALGLNPNSAADAAADSDGDGLTNLQEFRAGTSLTRADTDGDNLSDRDELERHLTDPVAADSDGDGLDDGVEAANPQLDPRSPDRDHDGVSDYWETRLQTNPTVQDGLLDGDSDGFTNRQESGAKSDPTLATELPARGTEMWNAQVLSAIYEKAAVGLDRTVYIVDDDHRLHAFWPDGTSRFVYGQPTFERVLLPTVGPDGSIYVVVNILGGVQVGSPRAFVRALDPDGTVRWSWSTTDQLSSPVAVGEDGRLYFSGARHRPGYESLYFVASLSASGTNAGFQYTQSDSVLAPAISTTGDVFFTTSTRVQAFTKSLVPRWTFPLRSGSEVALSIGGDGSVYTGDSSGYLYSIRPDGTLRWEIQLGGTRQVSSVAIGANGILYVGGYSSILASVNPADGTLRWSVPTSGTTFTPAVGADGTVYASTYGGDLYAFDPDGNQHWRFSTGGRLQAAPIVDRDGTIYVGTIAGQIHAIADNSGGPARTPWPMESHDSASTGYVCFNERAFSLTADSDGDHIDDCSEFRYGLDPHNAADGALDQDGDGLRNFEEHQHGSRLDLADTDGDGLADGLEVLTYRSSPVAADTDHDTILDGTEVAMGTNPLDAADAVADYDNDGFSNRQESLAGTDPRVAASIPVAGQLARSTTSVSRAYAVARDGTIYRTIGEHASAQLEALYPDFTPKWRVPAPSIALGTPVIGADGSIYMVEPRYSTQRVVAFWPNGVMRWAYTMETPNSDYGIARKPIVGSDGTVFFSYARSGNNVGDVIIALTATGEPKPGWIRTEYFGRDGEVAIGPNGTVAVYDPLNSLTLLSAAGARLWDVRVAPLKSGDRGATASFGNDGTIYARNSLGLMAVEPSNGSVRWRVRNTNGQPIVDAANRVIGYCDPIASRNLCVIDSTGAIVWTETTGYTFLGTPAIDASGAILVHTSNNRFVAFNDDGTVRWESALPVSTDYKATDGPIVMDDGTIFVPASPRDYTILGTGRGLAVSSWPARDRDNRGSRNAGGVAPITPSPAPTVMITDPRVGLLTLDLAEARVVRAQASDAAQGNLTAAIRWTSSLDGQIGTGATATLTNISVGTHTITASVTDNEQLTGSASFQATKGVIAPVLTMSRPNGGTTYDVGQTIRFDGYASDQRDGNLTPSIRWTSDRDGELGTGTNFERNNLTIGTHVITATVTDSSGASDIKTATIQVAYVGPAITHSPQNLQELEVGLPVAFRGTAWDPVDGNVAATLRWTSDRDGLIGTGPDFSRSDLSAGAHLITVTAHDTIGTTTTQQFAILIRAVPPTVSIEYPTNTSYDFGTAITFAGTANDTRDGDVSDDLQWSSSLDGPLGTGRGAFFRNDLSVGYHIITASVTDSDAQIGQGDTAVYVVSSVNSSPFGVINAPADGSQHYVTDPIVFAAYTSDNEDGAVMSIQWSSDRDGVLGTGPTLTTSTLSVGTHRIKLLLGDSTNGKSAVFITIRVLPLPANFPPVVSINPLPRGAALVAGYSFPLTATATDREDGSIGARVRWSSDVEGILGTGATVYVPGLTAGTHSITASVTDNYGETTSVTEAFVVSESGTPSFSYDSFSEGVLDENQWQPFDDGTSTPSSWSVSSGRAIEVSDAQAGDAAAAVIDKPGTYLRHTGGTWWLDYRLEATLRSSDDDALGLMFRFVDNNNYYRFSMDRERSYRRLVKKVNGVFTTLWQDATRYSLNSNLTVAITAQASQLTLAINGTQVYAGIDTAHRRGTIALYSWGQTGAMFDNVRVVNLRTSTANDAPFVTISSPANNTSVVLGTPVSFSATALDFEDGALSSSIEWSSSRDGALGTGASLTPGSLSVGAHVITARATDSQNATGTATVNLTITEPFNNPPTITVTAPTEGATFNVGSIVNFAGIASDLEDGTISNGITWTSSRSGLLGTGATLGVSMVAGTHTITARIQDSGGKFTTATRNITVIVPGNTQPTITLATPLNGAAFGVGQSVALSATAADTEDGTLTSSIAWSSNRVGALGTGGTVNTTALDHGIHTISATVNDSMGGTHSVTRTLNVVSSAATLLRDDFSDNNSTGWSVTNQGTVSAPSVWSASTGVLRQTADIHSTPTTAATVPKTGTFNRWSAGSAWTNYSVTTELRSGDNDTLGVMFRYTGTSNYYRFSMDSELAQRRLTKVRGGTWTTLWSDATAYQLNRTYVLEVIANGATITVKLDGVQLWSGTDSNALTSGTVAMYSWRNTDAQFDNILVRNLSVAFSHANEPRRGIERLRLNTPLLARRDPTPKPNPVPPRAPERIALVTYPTSDYRQAGGGVR